MPPNIYYLLSTLAQICQFHRRQYDMFTQEFVTLCDNGKLNSGMIDRCELFHCYRPQCNYGGEEYLTKQCSNGTYCWCSRTNGTPISGTFQNNMPDGFCCKFKSLQMYGVLVYIVHTLL